MTVMSDGPLALAEDGRDDMLWVRRGQSTRSRLKGMDALRAVAAMRYIYLKDMNDDLCAMNTADGAPHVPAHV
jgi:hypothetical protein